jgi:hypothetical protein
VRLGTAATATAARPARLRPDRELLDPALFHIGKRGLHYENHGKTMGKPRFFIMGKVWNSDFSSTFFPNSKTLLWGL